MVKKKQRRNYLFLIASIVGVIYFTKDFAIPIFLNQINTSYYIFGSFAYIGGIYALLKSGNWM